MWWRCVCRVGLRLEFYMRDSRMDQSYVAARIACLIAPLRRRKWHATVLCLDLDPGTKCCPAAGVQGSSTANETSMSEKPPKLDWRDRGQDATVRNLEINRNLVPFGLIQMLYFTVFQ